ncbi:MAG: YciI family protein [Pseudomonadota bacterium]
MHFTLMIYSEDGAYERLSEEAQAEVMRGHQTLQSALGARGPFATAKLMPSSHAVTLRPLSEMGQDPLTMDGPFADTKERFLGFYAAEFDDIDDAIRHASYIASPIARIEVRPTSWVGGVLATDP